MIRGRGFQWNVLGPGAAEVNNLTEEEEEEEELGSADVASRAPATRKFLETRTSTWVTGPEGTSAPLLGGCVDFGWSVSLEVISLQSPAIG
jgi:hypothetical protein